MARKPVRRGNSPSYSDYRRLTPDENEREGFTRKARRYVLKSVQRLTNHTPTLSARAHETLRTRQEYGLAKPEIATEARKHGALTYKTATARETATKTRNRAFETTFLKKAERDAAHGKSIKKFAGKTRGKTSLKVSVDTATDARNNNNKRLNGDHIPDGEYQAMMDYMSHYGDPHYQLMRGSPDVKGLRQITQ
jgi:hypothetical protein